MPTSYTSLLGLALPVTGELSGTWGDTVNQYITQYVDAAVAGAQTISGSQTAVTLSVTNGSSLTQAGAGATGSAQYQIINCTGNPASALTVTVPSASKVYLVLNNTSTSQTVTVKGAATTGVTVAAARCALIAWNGTDFELVATDDASKMNGVLAAVNGGTGQSSYAVGDILYASTTTALSKLADVATGNALISGGVGVAPSYGKIGLTTHVSGTLPVANGGTGLTSGTSGGVLGFTATGTIASSAALAANAIVIGGGAGATPTTTTTGTGVLTAIGNAVNTTGGLVTQSGTLAASSLLLGGGASTAISSTTTGTGVVTALGTAVGSAGAFVVNGGALGTPSSGTVTNLTGTASININGTVGATTPNTGNFTSVTSTSEVVTGAAGVLTRAAATQDGVELIGRAGGTTSLKVSLTPTTLTASRTLTLPDNSGTILTTGATVAVSNGGTGQTSYTDGQLLIGNTATTSLSKATLTAGSGVTITNGNGTITIAATGSGGTVTSVGATSPVASSGGTAPTISLNSAYGDTLNPYGSKTANFFLAAPNGAAGAPTFRAVVAADIPTLNQNTTGTAANITASSNTSLTSLSSLATVGTITSGTWSASFGAVSGANLTNLTAGNLSGTIPSGVLGNSSLFVGTTSVALNRASANQALTGITSVTFPGSTSGSVQLIPAATAGTGTVLTMPATTGTVITSGDTSTVTNTMLAGSIANAKLANSTISGVALGSNLNTLTLNTSGTGLSGSTTYNGSGAATFTVTSNATSANTASTIVARDASGNFSAGTITATLSGNATNVSGTVAVANGGTGQTTYTNGQLLIGNTTGNTLTKATLTAGTGISITNGAGSITIASSGGTGGTGGNLYIATNFGGF